jgi:signal transduction histidine kinase
MFFLIGGWIILHRRITMDKELDLIERHLYINQKMDIIGQIAGGVSHSFNNQLSGIMGFANLINIRAKDENVKKFTEEILTICKNSGEMVKDLLAFARYRPAVTGPVNAHGAIGTVAGLLASSIDKRIVIKQELNAGRYTILADAVQFQSVLLNLAINARDAMPSGGEMIFSTKLADGAGADGSSYIRIEVSDTGCGFGDDIRGRVFEPFFTTKEGRAGLGLAAAKRLAESMGGTIVISSVPGEGTAAAVTLPVYDSPKSAANAIL